MIARRCVRNFCSPLSFTAYNIESIPVCFCYRNLPFPSTSLAGPQEALTRSSKSCTLATDRRPLPPPPPSPSPTFIRLIGLHLPIFLVLSSLFHTLHKSPSVSQYKSYAPFLTPRSVKQRIETFGDKTRGKAKKWDCFRTRENERAGWLGVFLSKMSLLLGSVSSKLERGFFFWWLNG